MKIAWATDIHLNFLGRGSRKDFYSSFNSNDVDALLITGDISDATDDSTVKLLNEMADELFMNIYFVLGNHDYYHSSVEKVRQKIEYTCNNNPLLHWLPMGSPTFYGDDNIAIVGADGWADGRYGDYASTNVIINDSRYIEELLHASAAGRFKLLDKMQELADADAAKLKEQLNAAAAKKPKNIVVATHVPPFKEVCMYRGAPTTDDFLPFYSSKATGDVLEEAGKAYPKIKFHVFCGHTHGAATFNPIPNMTVKCGNALYGKPSIQEVFEL